MGATQGRCPWEDGLRGGSLSVCLSVSGRSLKNKLPWAVKEVRRRSNSVPQTRCSGRRGGAVGERGGSVPGPGL